MGGGRRGEGGVGGEGYSSFLRSGSGAKLRGKFKPLTLNSPIEPL